MLVRLAFEDYFDVVYLISLVVAVALHLHGVHLYLKPVRAFAF
jgi:hypothetical protein